jgi:DNA polymerase III subunit alpha
MGDLKRLAEMTNPHFGGVTIKTDFSLLDGFGQVEEYAYRAPQINQQYLCVTDHGMMGAIPRQIRACEAMGITPIFGCELYVQDKHVPKDRVKDLSDEEKAAVRKSYHLLAIAHNNTGYQNLVRLTSWSYLNGFYYKPRVTHEQLLKHKEGITFTSCCYNGEIGQAFDKGGPEAAYQMLEKYIAYFGKNFYLEIMLLDFNKQKPYDAWLMEAHDRYGIPLVCSQDCHFCNKEDSKYQQYMLMIQTKKTLLEVQNSQSNQGDDGQTAFELSEKNLWMKSEEELNAKWLERTDTGFSYSNIIPLELFEQAKRNTVEVCRKCRVELDRSVKLPQIPDADARFREAVIRGFKWRGLTMKSTYEKRLKQEFELITRKGFASYFVIQQEIIQEARRVCPQILGWGKGDEAIGPGRGSAVGSLVCYCLGITDVDPVKHGLLFDRFLSESRGGRNLKTRFTGIPMPEAA